MSRASLKASAKGAQKNAASALIDSAEGIGEKKNDRADVSASRIRSIGGAILKIGSRRL